MTERRFSFDKVADLYEKARPGYPDALFEDIATGLASGDRLLEIGSGSGKATEGFVRRGFSVLGIEPGAELIRVAKERLATAGNVRFVQSTFEKWPVEEAAFRLVFAAQSIHWVPPDVAFAKSAAALAPGGRMAVFGNVPMPLASPLRETIATIHERHAAGEQSFIAERWYLTSGPLPTLFATSGRFGVSRHSAYAWSHRAGAEAFVALLGTYSRCRILDESVRNALLADIRDAIDAHGGAVDVNYETHLHMAERL